MMINLIQKLTNWFNGLKLWIMKSTYMTGFKQALLLEVITSPIIYKY